MAACDVTAQQWQQFIVTSLSEADPCAAEVLGDAVAVFWDVMHPLAGCDTALTYLMARREALFLLMGCAARSIDTRDSRTESHMRSTQEQRQDGWSQAQSTNQNTSFADALSKSRYNDLANGKSRSESNRIATSQSRDDTSSKYDDIGSGAATTDTASSRTASSHSTSSSASDSTGSTVGDGARRGCNYSMSQNRTAGLGVNLGVVGGGYTNTASSWDMYMSQSARMDQTDTRDGSSSRHVHGASSDVSTSSRTSSSYFNALIDSTSNGTSASESHDTSTANKDASAHAQGAGRGFSDAKSKGENSAQATSQSHDDGEQHRLSTRSGFTIMDDVKGQQLFEHLKTLYDNATELITIRRAQLRAGQGPAVGALLIKNTDGYCAVGNLLAVGVPCCAPVRSGRSRARR